MSKSTRKSPGELALAGRSRRMARPVTRSLAQQTGWSEAEIVSFVGAAVLTAALATAVITAARTLDALLEMWPEPVPVRRQPRA